jgi:hypothetical protein
LQRLATELPNQNDAEHLLLVTDTQLLLNIQGIKSTSRTCLGYNEILILLSMKSFYRELNFRNLTDMNSCGQKRDFLNIFTVDPHSTKLYLNFTSSLRDEICK